MSVFDRHIQATQVSKDKPHIFFHGGFWRVNAKPRKVCRNPTSVENNRWRAAHQFICNLNGAPYILRKGDKDGI